MGGGVGVGALGAGLYCNRIPVGSEDSAYAFRARDLPLGMARLRHYS